MARIQTVGNSMHNNLNLDILVQTRFFYTRMLPTARRKQRGRFAGKKLSGTAKRAAELFDRGDTVAAAKETETVPKGISDQRSDHEVEAQQQLVHARHDRQSTAQTLINHIE